MIKAYYVYDGSQNAENYATVIFAENPNQARYRALFMESFEDANYYDLRARRFPQMDSRYRGLDEIDWYNDEDRMALINLGWGCLDAETWMCKNCVGKDICIHSTFKLGPPTYEDWLYDTL